MKNWSHWRTEHDIIFALLLFFIYNATFCFGSVFTIYVVPPNSCWWPRRSIHHRRIPGWWAGEHNFFSFFFFLMYFSSVRFCFVFFLQALPVLQNSIVLDVVWSRTQLYWPSCYVPWDMISESEVVQLHKELTRISQNTSEHCADMSDRSACSNILPWSSVWAHEISSGTTIHQQRKEQFNLLLQTDFFKGVSPITVFIRCFHFSHW